MKTKNKLALLVKEKIDNLAERAREKLDEVRDGSEFIDESRPESSSHPSHLGWYEQADFEPEGAENENVGPFESDFQTMFRQRDEAAAMVSMPDGTVDDLAQEVAVQRIRRAEKRKTAPWVRIQPPSASEDACVLGNQAQVTYGKMERQLVYWTGDDDEAMVFTLHLSPIPIQGGWPTVSTISSANASYRPYAKIQWGTRGVFHEAEVDVGNGTTLVLGGSSCYVTVGMDAPLGTEAPGTMQIGGNLTFFTAPNPQPPTRTRYIDSLAQGAGASKVTIPRFATALLPVETSDTNTAASMQIDVLNVAGVILYSLSAVANGGMITPLPLSSDAYYVQVTNNRSGSTANYRLMFALSL